MSGLGVGPGAFPPRLVVNALTVGIVRNISLVTAIVISFALYWGFKRMKKIEQELSFYVNERGT